MKNLILSLKFSCMYVCICMYYKEDDVAKECPLDNEISLNIQIFFSIPDTHSEEQQYADLSDYQPNTYDQLRPPPAQYETPVDDTYTSLQQTDKNIYERPMEISNGIYEYVEPNNVLPPRFKK